MSCGSVFTLFAVFASLALTINGEGYYTIVAPKSIRANSEYHVSVNSHGLREPCQIELTIDKDGAGETADSFKITKTVTVEPSASRMVQFEIPKIDDSLYKLKAKSISGCEVANTTNLNFNAKSFSVFTQTDKGIYKPGDLVRFRVLVLDSNTKPLLKQGKMNVIITDAKQNRIKQWLDVKSVKGVFSEELQLSNYPVLGDWTIAVELDDERHIKNIEVAEYVLPKFEVTIDSDKHTTYKEGKIRATIRAKYTYGKPVKGDATVSVYPKFFGSVQPFINQLISRKVVPVDGKGRVEFDIKEDMKIEEDYSREIILEAIVEEALTGRRQNTTKVINLHKSKYKIDLIQPKSTFIPDVPYEFTVKVSHHDGSPVTDKINPIVITIGDQWHYDETTPKPNLTELKYFMDEHGMAKVSVIFTDDRFMNVLIKYLDADSSLGYVSKASTDAALQIRLLTENPTVNKEMHVEVKSTDNITSFTYQVFGRGDIIMANSVSMSDSKTQIFKFLATFAMVPKAHVLVYYMKSDGEIVSDKLHVEFPAELQNKVKLEMSALQTSPGQVVDLTVTTKPNSFVGLLGVDQSVLLLKQGNDLSKTDVFDDLQKYDSTGSSYSNFRRKRYWRHHGNNWEDFTEVGAVLLTNAKQEEIRFESTTPNPFGNTVPDLGPVKDTTVKKTDNGPAHIFRVNTRPPLAGPFAFSRIPKPFWKRPRVYIMHDIADTWLFLNVTSGFEGKTTIQRKVPDTITSWVISAFSVDPVNGLGLVAAPRKLQVFQPFFVSTNLPYSVKRGEIISIPIVVFNYMENDVIAEVTLENTDREFEFTDVSNDIDEVPKLELYRRERVSVKANNGATVSFMITPKKVGNILIKIVATTPTAGDGVEKQLLVEPEGLAQYETKTIFADLREKSEINGNLTVTIPKSVVPDSTRIEVTVTGDLLGSTIKNLDALIRMPYGCGEQNMLNFVPNIVVLDYLTKIDQLNPSLKSKATRFMEAGYQRELTYKHDDGSFSAFGKSDPSGSVWLTAFVARAFRQAAKYIDVEEKIIEKSLKWLADNQTPEGDFPEVGKVSHKDMQGGAGEGIALTAYTLITFLENKKEHPSFANTILKSMDYIVKKLEKVNDPYALALAAYAMQLAQHDSKDYVLQVLDGKATAEDNLKWWHKDIPKSQEKNPLYGQPNSVNVEMTAYALLAHLHAGHVADSVPILKWLIAQRNSQGGFQSTQDTVVGIQALSKMAEHIASPNNNVGVVVKYNNGAETRMNVNKDNSMVLQSYELPPGVREVNISASGRGFAVVQLAYKYNMNVTAAWPRFTLDPQVNKNSNQDYLHLTVCTSFIPSADAPQSNMAVMEVTFPSGFTSDPDTLPSLESYENVKRVETKDGDTVVVIYFDNLDSKELCPTLTGFRTHKVAKQKPAPVTVYDYYDNSRRARMFYKVAEASLCDICDGPKCTEKCTIRAEERIQRRTTADKTVETELPKSFGSACSISTMPLIFIAAMLALYSN